jgi:hypothetical protein
MAMNPDNPEDEGDRDRDRAVDQPSERTLFQEPLV